MEHIINSKKREEIFIPDSKPFSNNYKERIIVLLKENDFGLTVANLTKKLGTTRHTISVALAELRGADLIEIRKVGVAKLHMLKQSSREVMRDEA